MKDFDYAVIVVGGGHAGTEAAYASARMGCDTLLLTQNLGTIGQMSCNPSIGGIGKSHLVYEIDALGGVMPRAADHAAIHVRTLNASRGPAVRATRAQQDRNLYRNAVRTILESAPKLSFMQQTVEDLIVENNRVVGVVTNLGVKLRAATVILTTGTFLGGVIHIGDQQKSAGRAGDAAANALAQRIRALPLRVGRLKTGTPPRLDRRSLDYSQMEVQPGETPPPLFSMQHDHAVQPKQTVCHITYTGTETCQIIADNLHRSPLYNGEREVTGPRYCPSLEVKIKRWFMTKGRDRHQVFVEPEGLTVQEVYPNGLSNCLPLAIQTAFIRSIPGFEKAHITQPGYAIEYDYLDPRDLRPHLESRCLPGLFLAGQINGTTGYEEAAAQGLLAGINAACQVLQRDYWVPSRSQAYLGVLVDDLISRGTTEPYRMFTSRAEHRLLLRQDNVYERLTAIGRQLGLIGDPQWTQFTKRQSACAAFQAFAGQHNIKADSALAQHLSQKTSATDFANGIQLANVLKRPEIGLDDCFSFNSDKAQTSKITAFQHNDTHYQFGCNFERTWLEHCVIELIYAGYISRAETELARGKKHLDLTIPDDFDFGCLTALSNEAREIFINYRPQSIEQANKLPGITPAAVEILTLFVHRHLQENHTSTNLE